MEILNISKMLEIDPNEHEPIRIQIYRALLYLVDANKLKGELPSPQQAARDLRVAPATIRNAYQDLVDAGVVSCRNFRYTVVELVS